MQQPGWTEHQDGLFKIICKILNKSPFFAARQSRLDTRQP
jgi:hypothetical protein